MATRKEEKEGMYFIFGPEPIYFEREFSQKKSYFATVQGLLSSAFVRLWREGDRGFLEDHFFLLVVLPGCYNIRWFMYRVIR